MRPALLLLCLAASAGAEERTFLEIEAPEECFEHQSIRLVLRIGIDRGLLENLVPLFSRELDVQVQVHAPWLEELPGAVLREERTRGWTLALNEAVVDASKREDRGAYAVFEIGRTCVPTRPGELVLAAPRLRYAYGTDFREDFVHGFIALDRRDAFAVGSPRALMVRPLPEQGRPPAFTGAVGRFSVESDASLRAVEAGATLKLVLRIEGEGDLELFDTPRLDGLPGFHVFGAIDDRGAARRTVTYDVAPLDARVTEVPAIPFAFFDPEAAAYRTVRTEPIPIAVRGDVPETRDTPRSWWLLFLAAAIVAVLLLLRARERRAAEPDAAEVFRAGGGADAFIDYLAARLGRPVAAVIAPDLEARLAAAGVPGKLARRAAALVERLVGARYGGAAGEDAEAEARALVDAMEAADEPAR